MFPKLTEIWYKGTLLYANYDFFFSFLVLVSTRMNGKDGEDMKSTAWQSRLEIDLVDKNGKIMCEK